LELADVDIGPISQRGDPPADAPTRERDADHRTEVDAIREVTRDEVVEDLVEAGDVGDDRGDEQRTLDRDHPFGIRDRRPR
jgi:hypothetical protein